MWTAQNRRRYDRSQLRYPSDLTDDEWALHRTVRYHRRSATAISAPSTCAR